MFKNLCVVDERERFRPDVTLYPFNPYAAPIDRPADANLRRVQERYRWVSPSERVARLASALGEDAAVLETHESIIDLAFENAGEPERVDDRNARLHTYICNVRAARTRRRRHAAAHRIQRAWSQHYYSPGGAFERASCAMFAGLVVGVDNPECSEA